MKRSREHQIEDLGYKQFESCLPQHWIPRIQTHDYGIDREVEIFNLEDTGDAVTTGCIFKVQVKGTEKAKINNDGTLIKYQLETDRVNYLCNEIKIPAFFILADITKNVTWWYAIQLDRDLKQKLAKAKGINQQKITLYIPSGNILPNTLELLVTTLNDIRLAHGCEAFIQLPQGALGKLSMGIDDLKKLEESFIDKIFPEKIKHFWKNKDWTGLEKISKELLLNSSSSINAKISAILCIEQSDLTKIRNSAALQNKLDEIYFNTAVALNKITKNENTTWRLFASITWRAALLRIACSDDFALYINKKIHSSEKESEGLDFICTTVLDLARFNALRKVQKTYNQCLRLIGLAVKLNEYWMIPQAVLRISQALPPIFIHLWNGKLHETASLFKDSVANLLTRAISISIASQDWDNLAQLVIAAFTINAHDDQIQFQSTCDWALEILSKITDASRRKEWLHCLEKIKQNFDPKNKIELVAPDAPTEEEYQLYIQMAQAMGIDLDDPNDQIAQIVKIGLQDLNPERVLKNCKHLFVYVGHYGIPAEMLKLYTAGSKYLRCLKKEKAIGGQS